MMDRGDLDEDVGDDDDDDDCSKMMMRMTTRKMKLEKEDLSLFDNVNNQLNDRSLDSLEEGKK